MCMFITIVVCYVANTGSVMGQYAMYLQCFGFSEQSGCCSAARPSLQLVYFPSQESTSCEGSTHYQMK